MEEETRQNGHDDATNLSTEARGIYGSPVRAIRYADTTELNATRATNAN
jgi:hypothetical protein